MSALIKQRNAPLLSYIALIVIGVALFAFGSLMLNAYGNKSKCTEPVYATVVRMEENRTRRGMRHHTTGVTYAPVFEYEYSGKQYTYTNTVGTNPPEFVSGDRVTIWVDPDAPNKIYYEPAGSSVLLSIAFRILGGLAAVGGLALMIVRKAKNEIA